MANGLRKKRLVSRRIPACLFELFGCSGPATPLVGVRPQKPAQIHADSERVAVELKWNAAAEIEFKVNVADRFVVNAGVVSVVAREVRATSRYAAGRIAVAVGVATAPAALYPGAAAGNPADFCLVPSRVADAEAFLFVAGWSCHVDGGTIIQGFVGIIPPQIRKETADANSRSSARITVLDRCGGAHKIERNAGVQSEVTRKVVSQSGAEIVDAAVAAVASFELAAQSPTRGEASGVIFCRPGCRGDRGLSEGHGTKSENVERAEHSCAEQPATA